MFQENANSMLLEPPWSKFFFQILFAHQWISIRKCLVLQLGQAIRFLLHYVGEKYEEKIQKLDPANPSMYQSVQGIMLSQEAEGTDHSSFRMFGLYSTVLEIKHTFFSFPVESFEAWQKEKFSLGLDFPNVSVQMHFSWKLPLN